MNVHFITSVGSAVSFTRSDLPLSPASLQPLSKCTVFMDLPCVQLEEAEAFLKAAGVELPIGAAQKKSKHKEKDNKKKHKKHKKDRDGNKGQ